MNDIESRRAEAEALREATDHPGGPGRHEDSLLRYLGTIEYDTRRALAAGKGTARAVARPDQPAPNGGSALH